jgi:hypothetical protein
MEKVINSVTVSVGDFVAEVTRAHDRPGAARLRHLFEAQRLGLAMLADIQTAIRTETAESGAGAVPLIAARMRAVAAKERKSS